MTSAIASADLALAQRVRARLCKIGQSMPRPRQENGFVKKTGPARNKVWTGFWHVYVMKEGVEVRKRKRTILGPAGKMNETEAKNALREIVSKAKAPAPDRATFAHLADTYLSACTPRWAEKTRKTMRCIFQRQILPQLGDRVASTLKKSDIEEALGRIAANPETRSHSLLKKCLTHIRAVFEQAVDDDKLPKNPAKKAQMPAYRKPSQRFLSVDECKRLLAAAMGEERDLVIVMLLLSCALRPSELFALKVDDVLPGVLRIDEAVVLGKVGGTKTDDSCATIPLAPQLEAALRNYIRTSGVTNLLFPSVVGTPMSHENYLARILKPLGAAAGIKGLNHQVLRRTAATHIQKHGGPKDAQGLLRHSNAETTLNNYMKLLDPRLASAVKGMFDELIGDSVNRSRGLVN